MDKVFVIGLDGVPFTLVRDYAAQGVMPNLAALMARGVSGELRSTVPPTSAPSWSSFMTGMNPGKTGIFDFLHRRPDAYQFPPVNSRMRRGTPLWTTISEAGGRVGVVNIPMSYPVDKVNGFMISGWMTPHDADDYLHPPELAEELKRVVGNYRIYPTETFSEGTKDAFFKASYDLMRMRTTANRHLMDKPWDFFMTVYFDTDRILHQLWHYLDPAHPWHGKNPPEVDRSAPVKEYFRTLDAALGTLLAKVPDDARVIVMSDHGMGAAYRFVVLNNWLLDQGFIVLKKGATTRLKKALFRLGFTLRNVHILVDKLGLAAAAEYKANYFVDHLLKRVFLSFNDVDWTRTRAYSFGRMLGSIYVNLEGREPQGIVKPGAEYEAVRREIVERLPSFRDPFTGQPLIGRVDLVEEIYHGPETPRAPDVTLWPADPKNIFFGLTDFGDSRLVATVYRYSGMHREMGMMIAAGPGVRAGAPLGEAGITDLAPTILHLMGLPVPAAMDGKVLTSILEPEFLAARPPRVAGAAEVAGGDAPSQGYNAKEEEEIMQRLADLGYLG